MFILLLFALSIESGESQSSRCAFKKCLVKVTNISSSEPFQRITNVNESGMVSMELGVNQLHVGSTTLFNLMRQNSSEMRLILKGRGGLFIRDKTGVRSLKKVCLGLCRINIGWRDSCYEKVEERYSDNEINILLNNKPVTEAVARATYIDLVLAQGSPFILYDLTVFDTYTSLPDMRRKVFESQRAPDDLSASLKWDQIIDQCNCQYGINSTDSSFLLKNNNRRVFTYKDLTPASKDTVVTPEHYPADDTHWNNRDNKHKDTFLYMNMDPDQACQLKHRYLVQEKPLSQLDEFSLCLQVVVSIVSSHLNIMHFVTQQSQQAVDHKSLNVMVDGKSLHLLRDLENSQLVTIPDDGKATVCVTVEKPQQTKTNVTVYLQSQQDGSQVQAYHMVDWFWVVGKQLSIIDYAVRKLLS